MKNCPRRLQRHNNRIKTAYPDRPALVKMDYILLSISLFYPENKAADHQAALVISGSFSAALLRQPLSRKDSSLHLMPLFFIRRQRKDGRS